MYYKIIDKNGFLILIGLSKSIIMNQIEISEEEYNHILSVIQSKPKDPELVEGATTKEVYMLKADTLEYELVEVEIPQESEVLTDGN